MTQNLNDAQAQAVLHREGPMLVLAGPGSGKTLVITHRIENLITDYGVSPSNILVITFTKAAANEMKERFIRRMPTAGRGVTFGTFHGVFFMVLKWAYHYQGDNILREEEKLPLMREIIAHMNLEYEDENEFIASIYGEISLVKNSRVDLEHYYSTNCPEHTFRSIYESYEDYLHRHRKIDFDDMLVYTYELFSKRKDILSSWQNKFKYILIDEFQDVNKLQYDIVRMLAAPNNNLFMVGDDDQSIYRFRGAKPEIMLHVPTDYPGVKQVVLTENYRSQENIVTHALRLIACNESRFPKDIHAVREAASEVVFELFESQREENKKVIERIQSSSYPYAQTAVLFRTNTQVRFLMEQLMEYNIPFMSRDNVPNLYNHWLARDMFAYMKIALGSRRREDFFKIMNRPKRYISRESLEEPTVAFNVWQAFYEKQPWIEERIQRLSYDIGVLARMRPFAALNYIRKAMGYDEFCLEYAKYRRMNEKELYEILDELQESSKDFQNYDAWFSHIENYTKELKEMQEKQKNKKEALVLATFHSAKGLEFDAVHIVDANEGIMPYKKAVLPADIEEERRMFYVGMTRAKKELYLYAVKKINNHETDISRFIAEAGG